MNHPSLLKPKSLDLEDACKYIGVGKTTIYKLFKDKRLKPVKIGRKTVIITSELDAFLDALAGEAA